MFVLNFNCNNAQPRLKKEHFEQRKKNCKTAVVGLELKKIKNSPQSALILNFPFSLNEAKKRAKMIKKKEEKDIEVIFFPFRPNRLAQM